MLINCTNHPYQVWSEAQREGFPSSLSVISRYRYSENDTPVLKNYRIASEN